MSNRWNQTFIRLVVATSAVVFCLLLAHMAVAAYLLLGNDWQTSTETPTAYARLVQMQLAIRALQINAGYGLGLVCIMLGVVSCWQGIHGTIEMSGAAEKLSFNLKTAQVGAVIVICGVVLIGLAITSPTAKIQPPKAWRPESNVLPGTPSLPTIEL